MKLLITTCAILFSLCFISSSAIAETKEALQARFKQRDAQLQQLKNEAKIGETFEGMVAARPSSIGDNTVKTFLDAENADRRTLYDMLAKEQSAKTKTTVTAASVAAVNATRNFKNAKPDHWLLVKADTWMQKKDQK